MRVSGRGSLRNCGIHTLIDHEVISPKVDKDGETAVIVAHARNVSLGGDYEFSVTLTKDDVADLLKVFVEHDPKSLLELIVGEMKHKIETVREEQRRVRAELRQLRSDTANEALRKRITDILIPR